MLAAMTGGEILPVAKVAGTVAKMAVSDEADKKALQELAVSSPNMGAAAESYARRIAVKQAVLLKIYAPLARFLGVSRTYFDTDFHSDMAGKLADIPEEHLTTPLPSVAIPVMQGLSYSLDEPNLKEMYLNLLATATDDRVQEQAHPSFAEIIKQLSSPESSLLLDALRRPVLPIIRLARKNKKGNGETTLATHIMATVNTTEDGPKEEPSLSVWVDNWIRLGLVGVDYTRSLVAEQGYAWVEDRPEFIRLAAEDSRGAESVNISRGILYPTDFGGRFLAAVSFDDVPLDAAGIQQPHLARDGARSEPEGTGDDGMDSSGTPGSR